MRMHVLETDRLILRRFTPNDAEFIFRLVNDPSWLRFIGDRGVRTEDDARAYVERALLGSYARFGFGLWVVELKHSSDAVGLCGLVKRDGLVDVDVGFALLPRARGLGHAREAVVAVLDLAGRAFGLTRVVAIANPDNHASLRILENTGFLREGTVRVVADGPELALLAASTTRSGK